MQAILHEHGFEVVGIASSGREAVAMARATRPDSVVMDILLPDMDGLTAGGIILGELPDTRIIAMTAVEHPDVVREALRSGFNGCLMKHATMPDVVGALIASSHSQAVIPMDVASSIVAASAPRSEDREWPSMLKQLTPREREVLGLLAEGMSGKDIAESLFLSRNTVRTHIQNILTKLQVHSRLQAAALATRHGIGGGSGASAESRGSAVVPGWYPDGEGAHADGPARGQGRRRVEDVHERRAGRGRPTQDGKAGG